MNKFASKGVATIVLSPKEVGGREFYQETMMALSNCSLTDPRPRPRKKVEFRLKVWFVVGRLSEETKMKKCLPQNHQGEDGRDSVTGTLYVLDRGRGGR